MSKRITEVEYEAARILVEKMLTEDAFFHVSGLRDVESLVDRKVGGRDKILLSAMHCVHWDKITPDVRAEIGAALYRLIGPPPTNILPPLPWWMRVLRWIVGPHRPVFAG